MGYGCVSTGLTSSLIARASSKNDKSQLLNGMGQLLNRLGQLHIGMCTPKVYNGTDLLQYWCKWLAQLSNIMGSALLRVGSTPVLK
jgi:hypothetical protein